MAIKLKKYRSGFTLVDSIIGLTIISVFTILFLQINQQMDKDLKIREVRLNEQREKYEKSYAR